MTTPDLSTPHATPTRSLAQRFEALERANDVRAYRAQLKRDMKAGRRSVLDVLTDPPGRVETMKVFDLLLAAPKYGRVKANKTLGMARINPSKKVGGLSERQRRELCMIMRRR